MTETDSRFAVFHLYRQLISIYFSVHSMWSLHNAVWNVLILADEKITSLAKTS